MQFGYQRFLQTDGETLKWMRALPIIITLISSHLVWWINNGQSMHLGWGVGAALCSALALLLLSLKSQKGLNVPIATLVLGSLGMLGISLEGTLIYNSMVFLIVVWMAFFGNRRELILTLAIIILWLAIPSYYSPTAPMRELDYERFMFVGAVAAVIGFTIHFLLSGLRESLYLVSLSEQRLQRLLNTAGEAYLSVDSSGMVLGLNQQTIKILGYSGSDLVGKPIQATVFPDGIPNDGEELYARRKDGSVIWVEVFIGHFEESGLDQYSIFLHDITSRKRAEEWRDLQFGITRYLAGERDLSLGIRKVLGDTGAAFSFHGASCWLLDKDHGEMYPAGWWTSQLFTNDGVGDLTELTWSSAWERDEDWIGSTWASGEPSWTVEGEGLRWSGLSEAGLKTGILIPMQANEKIVGVLEFLHCDRLPTDRRTIRALQTIANQLAQFTERTEAETRLKSSQALEINDDIVQQLVIVKMHQEMGNYKEAEGALERAIKSSSQIITRLVGDASAGELIRTENDQK